MGLFLSWRSYGEENARLQYSFEEAYGAEGLVFCGACKDSRVAGMTMNCCILFDRM